MLPSSSYFVSASRLQLLCSCLHETYFFAFAETRGYSTGTNESGLGEVIEERVSKGSKSPRRRSARVAGDPMSKKKDANMKEKVGHGLTS